MLKKKLAFEIFISVVVVWDILASNAYHLPTLQFFPMWVGAILEIEVGARILGWFSRHAHVPKLFTPSN